jgi:hypothetical protein
MKAAEIKKMFDVERNALGEVTLFTIHGWNKELPAIPVASYDDAGVDNAVSAIYAGADFLRHRKYDHPMTEEGLHFLARRGVENQLVQTNLGVVSINYAGDANILIPSQRNYPFGWAQVNLNNRIYTLSHSNDDETRARKHNFIDFIILGYTLEVRVPAFLARPAKGAQTAWIEVMIDQWETVDDAEALQKRNSRIKSKIDRDFMYAPIAKAKKNGGITASDFDNVKRDSEITLIDNTKVALGELAHRRYRVYNGSNIVRTMTWDGSDEACVYMAGVLKRNWKLEQI